MLTADLRPHFGEAQRERVLKRSGAGIAVVIVHIIILLALLTANQINSYVRQAPKETILILPPLKNPDKSRPALPYVVLPADRPVNIPPTIYTIPPVPSQSTSKNPADVMKEIGKALACGAGSYEYLSQAEREVCKRQPWHYKKNNKGVIVLDPTPPPPPEQITGIDVQTHTQNTTDACVASGSTHSECIHKTIFGR
ncbi:MAG TPA: hypothetical protein VHE09_15865 [Rhizomicrobium sp.]|nr:hypothetical protein [Rhizomicrobium sp.]